MAEGVADEGLRRRHAGAEATGAEREREREPAGSDGDDSRASQAEAPRARPQKGFVELLFSPLSFVLGDGEPEDPQVAGNGVIEGLAAANESNARIRCRRARSRAA